MFFAQRWRPNPNFMMLYQKFELFDRYLITMTQCVASFERSRTCIPNWHILTWNLTPKQSAKLIMAVKDFISNKHFCFLRYEMRLKKFSFRRC